MGPTTKNRGVTNFESLLMVAFLPLTVRGFRWFLLVLAVAGAVCLLPMAIRTFLLPNDCDTTELGKALGVLGLDIEITETDCWHDPLISIRAVKPGSSEKVTMLQYSDWSRTVPVITTPDDRTIQIAIPKVSFIACRRDSWETLTFRFDIGLVEHPSAKRQQC